MNGLLKSGFGAWLVASLLGGGSCILGSGCSASIEKQRWTFGDFPVIGAPLVDLNVETLEASVTSPALDRFVGPVRLFHIDLGPSGLAIAQFRRDEDAPAPTEPTP